MSALHLDFCMALQILSDADFTHLQNFSENETNIRIFSNILNSLKEI